MFSLIITIISIALVAGLAVATLYFGGNAFSQGSAKALASTVVSQAQQISAANTLFKNDNAGADAADLAALAAGGLYLRSAPILPSAAGSAIALSGSDVTAVIANATVCELINKQLDSTFTGLLADISGVQYGCVTTGTAPAEVRTFTFKG